MPVAAPVPTTPQCASATRKFGDICVANMCSKVAGYLHLKTLASSSKISGCLRLLERFGASSIVMRLGRRNFWPMALSSPSTCMKKRGPAWLPHRARPAVVVCEWYIRDMCQSWSHLSHLVLLIKLSQDALTMPLE